MEQVKGKKDKDKFSSKIRHIEDRKIRLKTFFYQLFMYHICQEACLEKEKITKHIKKIKIADNFKYIYYTNFKIFLNCTFFRNLNLKIGVTVISLNYSINYL